jgi:hypothetical protein
LNRRANKSFGVNAAERQSRQQNAQSEEVDARKDYPPVRD